MGVQESQDLAGIPAVWMKSHPIPMVVGGGIDEQPFPPISWEPQEFWTLPRPEKLLSPPPQNFPRLFFPFHTSRDYHSDLTSVCAVPSRFIYLYIFFFISL